MLPAEVELTVGKHKQTPSSVLLLRNTISAATISDEVTRARWCELEQQCGGGYAFLKRPLRGGSFWPETWRRSEKGVLDRPKEDMCKGPEVEGRSTICEDLAGILHFWKIGIWASGFVLLQGFVKHFRDFDIYCRAVQKPPEVWCKFSSILFGPKRVLVNWVALLHTNECVCRSLELSEGENKNCCCCFYCYKWQILLFKARARMSYQPGNLVCSFTQ